MNPLVIVIPYFGKWPFWIDFFMASCEGNPQVRWLIYTDCGPPGYVPPNVEIVSMRFEQYQALVSERLGVPFTANDPYKLTDIKPMLGFIHADRLTGFEFFAFGDLDVIYGDLLGYLRPLMPYHDCIATHARRISGHLSLFRNVPRLQNAFRRVPGWEAVVRDPSHRRFDESHYSKIFLRGKDLPYPLRWLLAQTDSYRRRALFQETYSTPSLRVPWIDGGRHFPEQWFWKPGSLTTDISGARQFPYLHFLYWKTLWRQHPEDVRRNSDQAKAGLHSGWRVTAQGFRPLSTDRA